MAKLGCLPSVYSWNLVPSVLAVLTMCAMSQSLHFTLYTTPHCFSLDLCLGLTNKDLRVLAEWSVRTIAKSVQVSWHHCTTNLSLWNLPLPLVILTPMIMDDTKILVREVKWFPRKIRKPSTSTRDPLPPTKTGSSPCSSQLSCDLQVM